MKAILYVLRIGLILAIVALVFGVSPISSAQASVASKGAIWDLRAVTDVGGIVDTDTTWTLSGSPYIVTSSVWVQSGVKLTIEPGVEVRFNAGKYLQIDGELHAVGTSDSLITFTSNSTTPARGDWKKIVFTDTSTDAVFDDDCKSNYSCNYVSGSTIQYAVIEYGGGGGELAELFISDSVPYIGNTTVRWSASQGIRIDGLPAYPWTDPWVLIRDSVITDNSGNGIYAKDVEGVLIYQQQL
jgi:hypothetical protein